MIRRALTLASLLTTPICVFISTSVSLYLGNQDDLFSQYDLLFQFIFAALALWLVGMLVLVLSSTIKYLAWSRCFYYFFGPAFLAYGSFHAQHPDALDSPYVVVSALIGLLIISIISTGRITNRSLSGFFALLGLALIVGDGSSLLFNDYSDTGENKFTVEANSSLDVKKAKLPNIYHIIVDGYQTEMFLSVIDKQTEEDLSGLKMFSNAKGTYAWTSTALASVMLGYYVPEGSNLLSYLQKAYSGKGSLLNSLAKKGYGIYSITPYKYLRKFLTQEIIYGKSKNFAPSDYKFYRWKQFRSLWIFAYLPRSLSAQFVSSKEEKLFKGLESFPFDVVAKAKSYYQYATDIEESLPAHGRYSFYHFTVPHPPLVLKDDCSLSVTSEGKTTTTTPEEQSRCVTSLTRSFIARLKELGRYDNSIIIIQADHGNSYTIIDGKLEHIKDKLDSIEFADTRSRPLLMLKVPSNIKPLKPLEFSDAPVTILDVAPTICEVAGLSCNKNMEGISLTREDQIRQSNRIRYFFYFDKKAKDSSRNQMYKYRIDPNGVLVEDSISMIERSAAAEHD